MDNVTELFCELRCIRNLAELHHTAIRGKGSFAAHLAFKELYDGLGDLIDGIIESYQGKYGIVKYEVKAVKIRMEFLERLKPFAELLETCLPFGPKNKNSYLYNQLDEVVTLLYQTIYKLENLE